MVKRSVLLVTGLVLAGLFGLVDVVSLPLGDGEHPPFAVALLDGVLGLITVVGVVLAWRGSRAAVVAVVVTRLLSGLTAVPAFFVDDVPTPAIATAAVGVVLTLVCVAFLAPALRSRT
ncbi:hypothetical protein OHB01_17410 [Microbispora hainanensis]|jgi:hypothetical protein|uniref:hypothetical protein n=1 Tax=Microbispora TaxID=2005 RepID=UPI0011583723|nr:MULTISPECIES: hypothetical protein [Microbispora]NJP24106.1 hypothetical protein [Microbispora sp. CL1-1]TQS14922.1 hypothetical protein FLW53_07815 [Microbispora sp. SCL1-1]